MWEGGGGGGVEGTGPKTIESPKKGFIGLFG